MITKREAAIITAYTGIMIGSFSELHKYVEHIMGRPVRTYEMGRKEIVDEIKRLSREDFVSLSTNIR